MLIGFYTLLLTLALFFFGPLALFVALVTGRYRTGLAQRLGWAPSPLLASIRDRQVVWLHAVSVGEVLAAVRLVAELEAALGPAWRIVISTTTVTGQALARQRFAPESKSGRVFFYPLDFPGAVRAYLRLLRPRLLILMESELWPNMLHQCRGANIPVAVVNARVSDRSFRRGMRLRRLWGSVLRLPALFLTQSDEDAARLIAMGANPAAVHATGNLKYDALKPKQGRLADLIRQIAGDRPILVAGSTLGSEKNSGLSEDEMLIQAWEGRIRTEHNALLVLAPRHPQRFAEVASVANKYRTLLASELLAAQAIEIPLFPAPPRPPAAAEIILLDTIGDLAAVYALATVAFVGGSLVPQGGHNPLEPARFAVPVVMGPSFTNFRDIVAKLQASDAIRIVPDAAALEATLTELLTNPAEAHALGRNAQAVFEQQQGALARTLTHLLALVCHPERSERSASLPMHDPSPSTPDEGTP